MFAEAGNEFIDRLDKVDETVNCLSKSISFVVDFQPTISGIKENAPKSKYRWTVPNEKPAALDLKVDNFFDTEESKEEKSLSQGNEDDVLACAADVINNGTTASASSDTGDDKG